MTDVITRFDAAMTDNYLLVAASVWAVCLFFVLTSIPSQETRNQNAFLIILVACVPLFIINAAWWAASVMIFYAMYLMFTLFARIVKGGK